jgi:hypothetical protein
MSDGILQGVRIATRRRIDTFGEALATYSVDAEPYRALTFYSVVLMIEPIDTRVDMSFSFNGERWRLRDSSFSGWDKRYHVIYAATCNEDGNIGFLIENTDKRMFQELIGTANNALRHYVYETPRSAAEWEYMRTAHKRRAQSDLESMKALEREVLLRELDSIEGLKAVGEYKEIIDKKLFEV